MNHRPALRESRGTRLRVAARLALRRQGTAVAGANFRRRPSTFPERTVTMRKTYAVSSVAARNHHDPGTLPLGRRLRRYASQRRISVLGAAACLLATTNAHCSDGLAGDAAPDSLGSAVAAGCSALSPAAVTAIGSDGNVPANTLDGNLGTRWSNLGKGSWIQLDLGAAKTLCSLAIAWYRGNVRTNDFQIAVSSDGTSFNTVFTGKSSGTTTALEEYDFADTSARFVRVIVNGNTENDWASITELKTYGSAPPTC